MKREVERETDDGGQKELIKCSLFRDVEPSVGADRSQLKVVFCSHGDAFTGLRFKP